MPLAGKRGHCSQYWGLRFAQGRGPHSASGLAGTREDPATCGCTRDRRRRRGTRTGKSAPRLAPSARSTARGRSRWLIFPAPQTASLGDATACAVPLKAAGSVLLSFSTGCQNMQIRGPESAAKSRRRRGAAGASPDPLLVWLFPAWPAAQRPSQQPPEPLPRPARLALTPTSPSLQPGRPPREVAGGGRRCTP